MIRRVLWLAVLLAAPVVSPEAARADLSTAPTSWANFPQWFAQTLNGVPLRDFEATGSCTDVTKGSSTPTQAGDISSGGPPYNVANCNPQVAGGTCCGTSASAFWTYYNGGGDTNLANDYYALRVRVNTDPRESNQPCLSNGHWNFLIDAVDLDGFKEWWIDVWGNQDRVRVLYEDLTPPNNTVANDLPVDGAAPYTETVINEMSSCSVGAGNFCGRNCANSHTRVCGGGSSATNVADCTTTADAFGEWYVDVQVPVRFLTDGTGNFGTAPITLGNPVLTYPPLVGFFFSTSDSSTDPLQKDFIATCAQNGGQLGPCDFGSTTPVTLSYFRAERTGAGVSFDWSTGSENGNVAFDLYVEREGRWQKVSERPVPSKRPFSIERVDYRVELDGIDGERFAIEDMDIRGEKSWHGPFAVERTYGARQPVARRDWRAIRAEHDRKSAERAVASARVTVPGGKGGSPYPTFDLLVDADGIYRVTYEQLAAAGLDLAGVAAPQLALTHLGSPVPIRVGGKGTFGPGSYVEFVGAANTGVYSRTNVYRLTADASKALRVREIATPPAGKIPPPEPSYLARTEVNDDVEWTFTAPGADPWYRDWILVYRNGPTERHYALDVDRLASDAGASLQVVLWGVTDWPEGPDHQVAIRLNGVELANQRYDGMQELALDLPIPDGLLVEGGNDLAVVLPAGSDGPQFEVQIVDRFGVTFRRHFEIENGALDFVSGGASFAIDGFELPFAVAYQVRGSEVDYFKGLAIERAGSGFRARFVAKTPAAGSRFFVAEAAALRTPGLRPTRRDPSLRTAPAQYLVISHPDFLAGLADLVAARVAEGYTVKVADVEAVYGEFGGGIFGPEAIRAYIDHAVANLGTEMVLIVGADTYDYFDHYGTGSMSFVPTLYAETGPIVKWAPVDSLYGDVDGDLVPDIPVGRFPAHGAAELAAMVAKTLEYPTAPHHGRAVFAADEGELGADFAALSEGAIAALPSDWQVQRAYVDDLGVAGARSALLAEIEEGVAFTQYLGHSDSTHWSFSGLFSRADAEALTNAGKPTVVVQWGCWNTFYVTPDASSMADSLLAHGDRGAAAVVGPSALSATGSDRFMSEALAGELFQEGRTLGAALVAAKQSLAATRPWMIDVIRGLTLLGDPALRPAP